MYIRGMLLAFSLSKMVRHTSQMVVRYGVPSGITGVILWMISFSAMANEFQPVANLVDAARQFLAALGGNNSRVTVDELDPRLRLPTCDVPLEASLATGARKSGRTNVAVRCRSPRPWLVYVPASVHIPERVLVSKRALAKGTMLTAEDVELAERENFTAIGSSTLRRLDQAVGLQLTRNIAGGAMLTAETVSAPLLVRRGAQVVIRARAQEFEVSMPGTALGDAKAGNRVRVKNLNSQRIVEGYVMTDGSVQVPM